VSFRAPREFRENKKIRSQKSKSKWAIILAVLTFGGFAPFMVSVIKRKNRDRVFFILNLFIIILIGAGGQNQPATKSSAAQTTPGPISVIGILLWIALFVVSFVIAPRGGADSDDSATTGTSDDNADDAQSAIPNSRGGANSKYKYVTNLSDSKSNGEIDLPTKYLISKNKADRDSVVTPSADTDQNLPSPLPLFGWWKARKLKKELVRRGRNLSELEDKRARVERLVESLNLNPGSSKVEHEILQISSCVLIEPRKGESQTVSTSHSSGRAFAGVRVGRVFVGGSGGSTTRSRSISYPAPDILKSVDSGKFILTTHGVSFAGSLFTKSTDYKKMLDFNSDGSSVLVAPKTGNKVWISQFPGDHYALVIAVILEVIFDSDTKILDDSEKIEKQSKIEIIESRLQTRLDLLEVQISTGREAISALKGKILRLTG